LFAGDPLQRFVERDGPSSTTRDLLAAAGKRTVVLITHRTDELHGVDTVSLGRNAVAAAAS
jgi:hypothetical protein